MKFPYLLATALVASQSLLCVFPKPGNAQLSCQETVDNIAAQIRSKGVYSVQSRVSRGTANEGYAGNPTQRQDVLTISMDGLRNGRSRSYYVIDNIMSSGQLMNYWANSIVKVCQGTAVVRFGQEGTDWVVDYAIQSDLTTQIRYCVNESFFLLSWDQTICY